MAVITRTVGPSGKDYTSLGAWDAGEQTNLVEDGDTHVVECDAFLDTNTPVTIGDTWTVGASNNITIRPAAGAEHDGSDAASGFYVQTTGSFQRALSVNAAHTVVSGIGCVANDGSAGLRINENNNLVEKCLFDSSGGGAANCVEAQGANSIYRNCVFKTGGSNTPLEGKVFLPFAVENCTFILASGSYTGPAVEGIAGNGEATITNTVAYGFDSFATGAAAASDYNASDLTGTPGANSIDSITTAAFNDFASGDYSPASSGVLDGAGADLSADFTDDINGATRTTPWDIGAYIAAVGGGGTTVSPLGKQSLNQSYQAIAASRLNGVLQ